MIERLPDREREMGQAGMSPRIVRSIRSTSPDGQVGEEGPRRLADDPFLQVFGLPVEQPERGLIRETLRRRGEARMPVAGGRAIRRLAIVIDRMGRWFPWVVTRSVAFCR